MSLAQDFTEVNANVTPHMTVVIAQLNYSVGDIEGNGEKILTAAREAQKRFGANCLICPELALTGYPPEDLLLRDDFHRRIDRALEHLKNHLNGSTILLGYPQKTEQGIENAAICLQPDHAPLYYAKQILPNYGVFDEKRYFIPGQTPGIFEHHGLQVGILICEDLWDPKPIQTLGEQGCHCVVVINASPFDYHKAHQRATICRERARQVGCPIIYAHCIGAQDELVFDGGSMAVNANGDIAVMGDYFQEQLLPLTLTVSNEKIHITQQASPISMPDPIAQTYQALTLGVRDYFHKNGFDAAVIGISGGVDSALAASVAVDALGRDNVLGVFMPSRHTSQLSHDCGAALAQALGIETLTFPIEDAFKLFLKTIQETLGETPNDLTTQNIQARLRGMFLMALANQKDQLVLATGNKSELAVGYCTLYGDMVGSFSVLKDVPKTLVYELCAYRNGLQNESVIPDAICQRAPTAELAFNQADTDSLPPYPILDPILEMYVEYDKSLDEIVAQGFDAATVQRVITMVNQSEYKRHQAPPGVRVSSRAFGSERRYPMTAKWG